MLLHGGLRYFSALVEGYSNDAITQYSANKAISAWTTMKIKETTFSVAVKGL